MSVSRLRGCPPRRTQTEPACPRASGPCRSLAACSRLAPQCPKSLRTQTRRKPPRHRHRTASHRLLVPPVRPQIGGSWPPLERRFVLASSPDGISLAALDFELLPTGGGSLLRQKPLLAASQPGFLSHFWDRAGGSAEQSAAIWRILSVNARGASGRKRPPALENAKARRFRRAPLMFGSGDLARGTPAVSGYWLTSSLAH